MHPWDKHYWRYWRVVLIVFDWDGTLCDSVARIVHAMQSAAQDVGVVPPTDVAVRNIIGLGLPQAMLRLFPECINRHSDLITAYSHHFTHSSHIPESALFDGVRAMLETFQSSGHELAVATGKSRRGLDRAFAQFDLGEMFTYSRCADEARSKPHPQMLQELLDVSWTEVADALMIGDSSYDLEMAAAMGMSAIGVTYGVHSSTVLRAYSPIDLVGSVEDLHVAIDRWIRQRG